MNAAQFDGITSLLREIRDRLPEAAEPSPVALAPIVTGIPWHDAMPQRPGKALSGPEEPSMTSTMAFGHRQALKVLLDVVDDWVRGAHENHDALEHRGENKGEECWRSFAPSDFRHMINDAARQLGIAEFPITATALEDVL